MICAVENKVILGDDFLGVLRREMCSMSMIRDCRVQSMIFMLVLLMFIFIAEGK